MREEKFKTLEVCTILWICTRCKAALNILLDNFQNLQAVEIHPNASQYHKQCLSSWSLLILFLHKAGKNHESLKVNSPGAASSQNRIFSNPQNLSIFQIYWFDLSKNFQNFLTVRGSSRSSSSGARYMILQSKIGWRKVKMCRFGSGKWFWQGIIGHFVVAGKCHSNIAPAEESVINMIWLLLSISDWPNVMIGPGGLLLVVPPTYLLSPFQFYGWGWKKVNN